MNYYFGAVESEAEEQEPKQEVPLQETPQPPEEGPLDVDSEYTPDPDDFEDDELEEGAF